MIQVDGLSKIYRVAEKQPGLAGTLRHFVRRRTRDVTAVQDDIAQVKAACGGDLDRLVRELNGRTPLRASALLFTIFAVIAAIFIWAWITEIDDVTRAPGRVVPAGDLQLVQAADAGVIRAIFVEEGDIVEAGASLVELDGLIQTSQLDREVQRAIALQARISFNHFQLNKICRSNRQRSTIIQGDRINILLLQPFNSISYGCFVSGMLLERTIGHHKVPELAIGVQVLHVIVHYISSF